MRGHKEDYDSWQRLGCSGWGWNNVEKYFRKMEDYFLPDGEIETFCLFSLPIVSVCFNSSSYYQLPPDITKYWLVQKYSVYFIR